MSGRSCAVGSSLPVAVSAQQRTPNTTAHLCAGGDVLRHTCRTARFVGEASAVGDLRQFPKLGVVVRPVVLPVHLNNSVSVAGCAVGTHEQIAMLASDGLVTAGEPSGGQWVLRQVKRGHAMIQPQTLQRVNHKRGETW